MHKRRLLYINLESIVSLLTENIWNEIKLTANGLPDDTRPINMVHDFQTDRYILIIESETFDPVPEGELLPEHPCIQFTRTTPANNLKMGQITYGMAPYALPREYYLQRSEDTALAAHEHSRMADRR